VVDAIDLVFFQQPEELSIERLRRGEIGAERLLDNEAAPRSVLLASETRLPKMATDRRECCWWRREIEKPVTVRVTCLAEGGAAPTKPGPNGEAIPGQEKCRMPLCRRQRAAQGRVFRPVVYVLNEALVKNALARGAMLDADFAAPRSTRACPAADQGG
jgi:hypothetical protein